MAGKGGGAWKVAYADFVTAMMAFFMVMWLTSQSEDLKKAVAEHFREDSGVFDFGGRGGKRTDHRNSSKPNRFTPSPVDVNDTPRSSIPRLLKVHDGNDRHTGTIIVFTEHSTELDETAQEQLAQLAPILAGKPQKIEIRGHASRSPLPEDSPHRDAWQLSYARCVAVMDHLEHEGISRERMRLSQAGPSEPYSILPGAGDQSHDGRVEIYLLAELVEESIGTREERERLYNAP
jgi:chemotaxis protein MotB